MAFLGPKKDGGPNVEFFQSPESLQGFEKVKNYLQKNIKQVCVYKAGILCNVRPQRHT